VTAPVKKIVAKFVQKTKQGTFGAKRTSGVRGIALQLDGENPTTEETL